MSKSKGSIWPEFFRNTGCAEQLLFERESVYRKIRVVEQSGTRYMLFGPEDEQETACSLADPDRPVFEYPSLMVPALALKPDTKTVLLIGLGGGYLPGLFQRYRPDIALTVVELDPMVLELAREFFGFVEGGSVRVLIAEGRDFLEKSGSRYDQIWLDAYDGEYIPAPLTTIEFMRLCRERLSPHGVLAQNVHPDNALFPAQLATMTEAFGYFYKVRGKRGTNATLIAQKDAQRPASVRSAFARGLKMHGTRFGSISLTAELRKAGLAEYVDKKAILTDAACCQG